MTERFYASALTVVVGPDCGVYVEMRDADGTVKAVAGLQVCAAVDFNEQLSAACHRALAGPVASGLVH